MGRPIQRDLFTPPAGTFVETIRGRIRGKALLSVAETAAILDVSNRYIHTLIEEGRLTAANFNHGAGNRQPFYKITAADVIDLAERIAKGI